MDKAMIKIWLLTVMILLSAGSLLSVYASVPPLEVVSVQKIWDKAPHNAFTDLVRFQDRWWVVFREGQKHVAPDGALRIITSIDGEAWESAALIQSDTEDLRDGKLSVTPGGSLMLIGAGAYNGSPGYHQTYAWFSSDGRTWSKPVPIGERNYWMWRVTWYDGVGYGIAYPTHGAPQAVRLYRTTDGRNFVPLVDNMFPSSGYSNEASMIFLPNGTALTLLRRDPATGTPATSINGQLGIAKPPYTDWSWKDTGYRVGGPQMIRLPDGRILAAVRLYNGNRTSLCWLDPETGKLTEAVTLPSGGDTSYAGMVWHDGLLWVSYYSSHEGKPNIYLAKVRVPAIWITSPANNAVVNGNVSLAIQGPISSVQKAEVTLTPVNPSSAVTSVQLYTGNSWPNQLVFDSRQYPDGAYDLVVNLVTTTEQQELKQRVVIDNWLEIDDAIEPPVSTGWFGMTERMHTYAKSSGWEHKTTDADSFFGDSDRIKRQGATSEFLTWECPGLQQYTFTFYAKSPQLEGSVGVDISLDGDTWYKSLYRMSMVDRSPAGWLKLEVTGSVPDEQAARFIRLTVQESQGSQELELGHALMRGLYK